MERIAKEKLELSSAKNANYAGEENAWANFDLVAVVTHGKITREQGIFVRMVDKMARLGTLLFDGQDEVGESIDDTVKDLGIYADILYASRNEERLVEKEEKQEVTPLEDDKVQVLNALRQFFSTKA